MHVPALAQQDELALGVLEVDMCERGEKEGPVPGREPGKTPALLKTLKYSGAPDLRCSSHMVCLVRAMVVLRFCWASIGGYRQGRCFDGFGMDTPPGANDAHVGKADTLEGFAASLAERLTRH
jgi:hypothetical protein